jgi:hypothetical protein
MAILATNDFGDGKLVLVVSHNPTSTVTDCDHGSLIIEDSTAKFFRKNDNGPTTNVSELATTASLTTSSGSIFGAHLSWTSVTTVTLGIAGVTSHVRNSTDVFDMSWLGVVSADITVIGAGGLDAGAESGNTWYAVYVIGDTTNVNAPTAILTLSSISPTMPAGYDVFRRISWVRNDGSSNFRKFFSYGNQTARRIWYDSTLADLQALSAGNATAFSPVSLSAFVPSTSTFAHLLVGFENTGAGTATSDYLGLRPTGSAVTYANTLYRLAPSVAAGASRMSDFIGIPTNTSQSVDYAVTVANDSADVFVPGWEEDLN